MFERLSASASKSNFLLKGCCRQLPGKRKSLSEGCRGIQNMSTQRARTGQAQGINGYGKEFHFQLSGHTKKPVSITMQSPAQLLRDKNTTVVNALLQIIYQPQNKEAS